MISETYVIEHHNFGRMKLLSLILLVMGSLPLVQAQGYFQQRVDYVMEAELDTTAQELTVTGEMTYVNASPDALDQLVMHLWWNAFGDVRSAFALQQFEMGSYEFHYAKDEDRGQYRDLQFSAEGSALEMQPYQGEQGRHSDIALLKLAEPIGPGEEQTLQFSYVLKIPKVFSRPGHDGSLYRMTQWYPKPCLLYTSPSPRDS